VAKPADGNSTAETKSKPKPKSKPKSGAAPKAKPKVKTKAKKPKAKPRGKVLSPEEKEQRQAAAKKKAEKVALRKKSAKAKTQLEDLKAAALPDVPKKVAFGSAWNIYWAEQAKAAGGAGGWDMTAQLKEAAEQWKQLPSADLEVRRCGIS
jgi:type IV secretory pathway VirB10-like protein